MTLPLKSQKTVQYPSLLVGFYLPAVLVVLAMWSIHTYTVDDAFISYRYAQNLAAGNGLVYNVGERVEGYTNFLWTVLLAGGIKLGVSAELLSKLLGGVAAILSLALIFVLSGKLTPGSRQPVFATWLVAGSMVFSSYAVQGLESTLFAALLLAGTLRFVVEEEGDHSVFGSALIFALAGLTRPEAPLYFGMLMLLGSAGEKRLTAFLSARNLQRGAVFAVPLCLHLLWRHDYYGSWLPNTLFAKTGDRAQQWNSGIAYLRNYLNHEALLAYLAVFGVVLAFVERHRVLIAVSGVSLAASGYVVLVGGDWMPLFRFMVPILPFIALLADALLRRGLDTKSSVIRYCSWCAVLITAVQMGFQARTDHILLRATEREWNRHAGKTSLWFAERESRFGPQRVAGSIALGDIGEVGFVTGYEIVDLLGLVDPVIARMPGGYTRKTGQLYRDYFFRRQPRYVIIISGGQGCLSPSVPGSVALYQDTRFHQLYGLTDSVLAGGEYRWCIYEDKALQLSAVP